MIEGIGGVTSQLIGVALDAAMLRHEVIANNIANADTPGFQAKRLSFEEHLTGYVSRSTANEDSSMLQSRVDWAKNALNTGDSLIVEQGSSVELDREMIELTENTLRYQALLQAAGKRGELVKMAVREGRR